MDVEFGFHKIRPATMLIVSRNCLHDVSNGQGIGIERHVDRFRFRGRSRALRKEIEDENSFAGNRHRGSAADECGREATAKVEQGVLQGTNEDGLTVYKGIPFAAPPVGDLRWRAPQPAAKWEGVRPADKFAPQCVQGIPRDHH